jgi:hypothetical protein
LSAMRSPPWHAPPAPGRSLVRAPRSGRKCGRNRADGANDEGERHVGALCLRRLLPRTRPRYTVTVASSTAVAVQQPPGNSEHTTSPEHAKTTRTRTMQCVQRRAICCSYRRAPQQIQQVHTPLAPIPSKLGLVALYTLCGPRMRSSAVCCGKGLQGVSTPCPHVGPHPRATIAVSRWCDTRIPIRDRVATSQTGGPRSSTDAWLGSGDVARQGVGGTTAAPLQVPCGRAL